MYLFRVNSTKPKISPYFRRIIAITLLNFILGRKTKIKVGNHLILFHLNWDQAQEIGKKLRSKSCFICIFIAICVRHIGFFVSKYIVNFHLFIMCIDIYSPLSTCKKSKRCNKSSNHRGKCNSEKQSHKFWVNSPVYKSQGKSS